jgi:hypothetical protein
VADLTDARHGLPKEFSTAAYEVTQEWADHIRASGADGLVHWLRLDPADGRGAALFADGPDDDAAGFALESFPLIRSATGDAFRSALPQQLFAVVDLPDDADIDVGDAAAIPPA